MQFLATAGMKSPETVNMKAVLVVFAVALAATYAADDLVGGLQDPYPRTLTDAEAKGWTQQKKPNTPHLPSLMTLYCPKLEVVCTFYDDTGYIGGIQLAMSKDYFTSTPYDLVEMGWTEWKPSSGNDFWTAQIYFVTEEFLETSSISRVASRNPNEILQLDSVWITDINGTLAKLPRSTKSLSSDNSKQSGFPAIGTYYFQFNLDVCSDTTLPAFIPTYHDGYLTAIALSIFGKMKPVDGVFELFKLTSPAALEELFSNAPGCMRTLVHTQPGIIIWHRPRYVCCG